MTVVWRSTRVGSFLIEAPIIWGLHGDVDLRLHRFGGGCVDITPQRARELAVELDRLARSADASALLTLSSSVTVDGRQASELAGALTQVLREMGERQAQMRAQSGN